MKNTTALTVFTAVGGAAALILRLAQERIGFSAETGLLVPGSPLTWLLPVSLIALGAALFFLARCLPSRHPDPRAFEDIFSIQGSATLLLCGVALLILSGAVEVLSALADSAGPLPAGALPSAVLLLSGGLTALAGLCLLPHVLSASRGRRSRGRRTAPPALLLLAPAAMVFRLVLVYRTRSSNPTLSAYALEILALSFASLAFFQLASFAFGDGNTRVFSFLSGGTVILCAASLADGLGLVENALFGGCAFFFLGLLYSLQPLSVRLRGDAYEEAKR